MPVLHDVIHGDAPVAVAAGRVQDLVLGLVVLLALPETVGPLAVERGGPGDRAVPGDGAVDGRLDLLGAARPERPHKPVVDPVRHEALEARLAVGRRVDVDRWPATAITAAAAAAALEPRIFVIQRVGLSLFHRGAAGQRVGEIRERVPVQDRVTAVPGHRQREDLAHAAPEAARAGIGVEMMDTVGRGRVGGGRHGDRVVGREAQRVTVGRAREGAGRGQRPEPRGVAGVDVRRGQRDEAPLPGRGARRQGPLHELVRAVAVLADRDRGPGLGGARLQADLACWVHQQARVAAAADRVEGPLLVAVEPGVAGPQVDVLARVRVEDLAVRGLLRQRQRALRRRRQRPLLLERGRVAGLQDDGRAVREGIIAVAVAALLLGRKGEGRPVDRIQEAPCRRVPQQPVAPGGRKEGHDCLRVVLDHLDRRILVIDDAVLVLPASVDRLVVARVVEGLLRDVDLLSKVRRLVEGGRGLRKHRILGLGRREPDHTRRLADDRRHGRGRDGNSRGILGLLKLYGRVAAGAGRHQIDLGRARVGRKVNDADDLRRAHEEPRAPDVDRRGRGSGSRCHEEGEAD